jgi:hypothetical protein
MKQLFLVCLFLTCLFSADAQTSGNRVNLKYKITKKKVQELRDKNFLICIWHGYDVRKKCQRMGLSKKGMVWYRYCSRA